MADAIWASGFLLVIVGSVAALLLGIYLDHRQNMARIQGGVSKELDPLGGRRRALGWGLGCLFGGAGLLLGSFFFSVPGESEGEGLGVGLVIAALGLALVAYTYLAPKLKT